MAICMCVCACVRASERATVLVVPFFNFWKCRPIFGGLGANDVPQEATQTTQF